MIGEGGFGQVFVADQTEPVRRRVALKILRPGMDSKAVLVRFEAERQALAIMDHPNVAKVFDAGRTEDGRPYFVMEYIQGLPITKYADDQKLGIRDRLRLFQSVCAGLQHAHQKAVIHRDIKPSNVLVASQDGRHVAKIIDFGIAKALAPLTEESDLTQIGQMIGTPAYMSPEQADATGQGIDTRTDVYSLGAVLYELLTGAPPFDPAELRRVGFGGIRRYLREQEPLRPSARVVSPSGGRTPTFERPIESARLSNVLKGELDWITLKALEKEQARRYGSPAELAADIERYLTHEPVLARPASARYRAQKFLRRHRVGVAFVSATFVFLLSFGVATLVQSQRIARERDRANAEARVAREVSRFLVGMFEVADPSEQRGREITAEEILGMGAERIRTGLMDQPVVRGRLMGTLGEVYRNLGIYTEADSLLRSSVEIHAATLGPDHPETVRKKVDLAILNHQIGRMDEAAKYFDEALLALTKDPATDPLEMARVQTSYGAFLRASGDLEGASAQLGAALETKERLLAADDPEIATSLNNLGAVRLRMGKYEEARDLYERALAIKEAQLGEGHPQIATGLANLAMAHQELSDFAAAQPLLERALAIQERTLGPDHPELARTIQSLAALHRNRGQMAEAGALYDRALSVLRTAYGSGHRDYLSTLDEYGIFLRETGRVDEAREVQESALAERQGSLGSDHPDVAKSLNNLAKTLSTIGDYPAARERYLRALEIYRQTLGAEHPYIGGVLNNVADIERKMGDLPSARAKYAEARGILQAALGPTHPNVGVLSHNVALVDRETGAYDRAERGFLFADSVCTAAWGQENPFVAENAAEYAVLLRAVGREAEARAQEERARRIREAATATGK